MVKAVMVVTPQNSFRFALEQLLQNRGYVVCPGATKLEAFRHALNASETPPNVILLDFWLSHAETTNFIKELKRQGFTIILMGTRFQGQEIATQEGILFLEKPFTQHELATAIK